MPLPLEQIVFTMKPIACERAKRIIIFGYIYADFGFVRYKFCHYAKSHATSQWTLYP